MTKFAIGSQVVVTKKGSAYTGHHGIVCFDDGKKVWPYDLDRTPAGPPGVGWSYGDIAAYTPTPPTPPAPPTPPTPPVAAWPPKGASWAVDFADGKIPTDLYHGGPGDPYGIVDIAAIGAGLAVPADSQVPSAHAIHFSPTSSPHAKVYKTFQAASKTPPSVLGTYSARMFFPADFAVSATDQDGPNIFQFKEQHASGSKQSNPSWWLQLIRADWLTARAGGVKVIGAVPSRKDAPVLFLNCWGDKSLGPGRPWDKTMAFTALPLGQWVQLDAVVQPTRSDYYLNGALFDTAQAKQFPTLPFFTDSMAWIYGIGDYSDNVGQHAYASMMSYTPA